ncbi:hypothetical protein OVA24_11415 [Luteolibacter sp. SL250]|uniref:hypothetical protein n=1 Tax=Luteolibacter sp. SL250 TaxID=2995170 RepID=UPI00226E61A2|nr:hypothetical protein [Luteolibacter sp. SL250]WAC17852.1 hypothetical protein OVA24_11415 [Luteolibacter sp. SL250]
MKTPVTLALLSFGMSMHLTGSTLRVLSVATSPESFPADDRSVIFRDEFDVPPAGNPGYVEHQKGNPQGFTHSPDGGLRGGGMTAVFEKGQVENGSLKVFFGRTPAGSRGLRKDETFREIYWRVYVKHEAGWEGNPAKFGRTTCLMSPDWKQGFIAHVWGGKNNCLCIDPATGIVDSNPVTTRYNDFANLKWLGARHGGIPVFSSAESGRWVCVESHVRLNSPGKADGIFQLWVDGKLEASRHDINWHGNWDDYAINAVFLENHWNDGSKKRQSRWFDHFVIRTEPIGPATAARPVTIGRTVSHGDTPWEVEIAKDPDGKEIVWKSSAPIPSAAITLTVDDRSVPHAPGVTYWVRIRKAGEAEWSPWHSPFR